jgi:hypothetical protein
VQALHNVSERREKVKELEQPELTSLLAKERKLDGNINYLLE